MNSTKSVIFLIVPDQHHLQQQNTMKNVKTVQQLKTIVMVEHLTKDIMEAPWQSDLI